MPNTALIIIDMQNDFMPGGVLAVPNGNEIIDLINQLQLKFDLVIATQDWHPAIHKSFATNHANQKPFNIIDLNGLSQTLWPAHCVQNTSGAELVNNLNKTKIQKIIHKGTNPNIDSYSAFFDNAHLQKTDLDDYLKLHKINTVYIAGVATDYCAKFSALDAIKLGYKAYLLEDACKGINLQPDDIKNALDEMREVGVKIIASHKILKN